MKLFLDTASSLGWFALDNAVICLPSGFRHSHQLVEALRGALESNSVTAGDISEIAVGRGPGSYTGIRVAAAVATGLALGTHVPIASFCSLQAFAPKGSGTFLIAFDARGGGAYVLSGLRSQKHLAWDQEVTRMSLDELADLAQGRDQLVTPDLALKERLPLCWSDARPCPPTTLRPSLDLCYLGSGRVLA